MMPDDLDELLSATESSTRNEAVWELQSFLLCGFILHTHPFWLVWLTLAITGISFLLSCYLILVALPRKRRAYWETYAWEYDEPLFVIRDNVVEGSDPVVVAGERYEPGPRYEFAPSETDRGPTPPKDNP